MSPSSSDEAVQAERRIEEEERVTDRLEEKRREVEGEKIPFFFTGWSKPQGCSDTEASLKLGNVWQKRRVMKHNDEDDIIDFDFEKSCVDWDRFAQQCKGLLKKRKDTVVIYFTGHGHEEQEHFGHGPEEQDALSAWREALVHGRCPGNTVSCVIIDACRSRVAEELSLKQNRVITDGCSRVAAVVNRLEELMLKQNRVITDGTVLQRPIHPQRDNSLGGGVVAVANAKADKLTCDNVFFQNLKMAADAEHVQLCTDQIDLITGALLLESSDPELKFARGVKFSMTWEQVRNATSFVSTLVDVMAKLRNEDMCAVDSEAEEIHRYDPKSHFFDSLVLFLEDIDDKLELILKNVLATIHQCFYQQSHEDVDSDNVADMLRYLRSHEEAVAKLSKLVRRFSERTGNDPGACGGSRIPKEEAEQHAEKQDDVYRSILQNFHSCSRIPKQEAEQQDDVYRGILENFHSREAVGLPMPALSGDFYSETNEVTRGVSLPGGSMIDRSSAFKVGDSYGTLSPVVCGANFASGLDSGRGGDFLPASGWQHARSIGTLSPVVCGVSLASGLDSGLGGDFLQASGLGGDFQQAPQATVQTQQFEYGDLALEDSFATLEAYNTLFVLCDRPFRLMNCLQDFLTSTDFLTSAAQVVVSNWKVRRAKCSIKAKVSVDKVPCTLKARCYTKEPGIALEIQRRSGDSIVFCSVFRGAWKYLQENLPEYSIGRWSPPPLSFPEEKADLQDHVHDLARQQNSPLLQWGFQLSEDA